MFNILKCNKKSLFVCFFFTHSIGQSIADSRCYLDGGGSAESLTANEDLSVGSVIGKYPIHFGRAFFFFCALLWFYVAMQ